ncbi:10736_t:CDS:2, partial [Acaulospora colombiana]
VAYRSFSPSEFEARGARKVTTGMNTIQTSQALYAAESKTRRATHLDAGKSRQDSSTRARINDSSRSLLARDG